MNAEIMAISYQYDLLNRLTQISNSSGDVFGFNYDLANRLTQISRPGSVTSMSYLDSGAITEIRHTSNGVTKALSQYQYDARSLPIQKRNIAGVSDYTYDGNGQLTGVSGLNPESFVYDSIGNRLSDQDGSYSYDGTGQKLDQDYQYFYTYDNNGNLTGKASKDQNKNSFNYVYSSKNQLTQVVVYQGIMGPVQKQIYYHYDVLGRRMQKEVVDKVDSSKSYTRKYVYDGDNVILEYDSNNNILAKYTHSPLRSDDILEAEITTSGVEAKLALSSGKFYYLKDALGSITDVADSGGNIVQKYEYSSFGKVLSIKNESDVDISSNPVLSTSYSYTGREYELETGLYYYRARYYDSAAGRFVQKDPHPGRISDPNSVLNKYLYAANNPILYRDPSGKDIWNDITGIVGIGATIVATIFAGPIAGGAVAGAFLGILDNQQNGGNWLEQVARGALGGALFGLAISINPAVGFSSLGVSIAKAGSRKGNFYQNIVDSAVQDGAFSLIGAAAVSEFQAASQIPFLGNAFAAILAAGQAAATAYTGIGFSNNACDPEHGGLYRSDLCSISRGINGN